MGGLKKFAAAAAVSAFAWTSSAPTPVVAEVVFRATCGSLKGHRVNMDPLGKSNIEKWTPEFYPAGPPPKGTGTLTFVSDSTDTSHLRVKWTSDEQLLPIVFKSEIQISVADVDEFGGLDLFPLLPRRQGPRHPPDHQPRPRRRRRAADRRLRVRGGVGAPLTPPGTGICPWSVL